MEASEATESTEAQAPETDPTTDAPQETEATETEQTEAAPPQLNDALQSLNAQMAELTREVRGEEAPPDNLVGALGQRYEDEPEEGVEQQQAQQIEEPEDDQLLSELNNLIREGVQEVVTPYFQAQESQRREQEILALAEQYPRLKEPEVVSEVAGRLRALAERYGNPALQTDPELVKQAYQAYEAQAAAGAETPAEAAGQGATLEAGAGPSAPASEVDPVQQQYEKAIASAVGEDPLTS